MDINLTPKEDKQHWKIAFLDQLRLIPNVAHACDTAGMSRQTAYHEKKKDVVFAEAWEVALDEAIERLEYEMHRRAYEGVDHPVIYRGKITNTYKAYSDTLAIFLAKAHRPEKYRERSEVRREKDVTINVVYEDGDD
jgi:AcrR family transcriptional regulator